MLLGYNSWSMPTLDIDTTVRHLAKLGYDSMELTICPGWPTEALGLEAAERRQIKRLMQITGCG